MFVEEYNRKLYCFALGLLFPWNEHHLCIKKCTWGLTLYPSYVVQVAYQMEEELEKKDPQESFIENIKAEFQ